MTDYSNMTTGIQATMSKLTLTAELKTYIQSNQDMWKTFGKMSSHIYRKMLMDEMEKANLKNEEKLMVFFFFSVIKNQPRIVKAMKNMNDADRAQTWYNPVFNFISTRITQYVSQANSNNRFPAVNVPTCNPGLDIFFYKLITKPEDRSIDDLKNRTTFSQLHLDSEMQGIAKEGYKNYWDNVVKGSKNPDKEKEKLEAPQMREEYYLTGASDQYLLLDDKFKEITAPTTGYTRATIENYLK